MKTSSLLVIVLSLVTIISLAAIWFVPSLQDFMTGNTMWNGVRDFSREYQTDELDLLSALPESTGGVLIEIPYTAYSSQELQQLSQYVSRGNTLVLMDDVGHGNSVLEYLGLPVRFSQTILLDPLFCYKNSYLPRITTFSPPLAAAGIQAVVLNHAAFLEAADSLDMLAWSSPQSFTDRNGNGNRDQDESPGPFPVAAEYIFGQGRVEVVSDPSLIINTMLNQNDNDRFMRYLIERSGVPTRILLDRSHLSTAPLDTAKTDLQEVRHCIAHPYFLIFLVAVSFIPVVYYLFKKGEIIG